MMCRLMGSGHRLPDAYLLAVLVTDLNVRETVPLAQIHRHSARVAISIARLSLAHVVIVSQCLYCTLDVSTFVNPLRLASYLINMHVTVLSSASANSSVSTRDTRVYFLGIG